MIYCDLRRPSPNQLYLVPPYMVYPRRNTTVVNIELDFHFWNVRIYKNPFNYSNGDYCIAASDLPCFLPASSDRALSILANHWRWSHLGPRSVSAQRADDTSALIVLLATISLKSTRLAVANLNANRRRHLCLPSQVSPFFYMWPLAKLNQLPYISFHTPVDRAF